jgi:hypothetical protein
LGVRKNNQLNISNRFAALENVGGGLDINMRWYPKYSGLVPSFMQQLR